MAFPSGSDTAPPAMSSCGSVIWATKSSLSRLSVIDIVSESGAAALKPEPSRETSFSRPLSLTYSLARSISETSISSLNAMVMRPVSAFKSANAKAGRSSGAAASFTI